MASLHLKQLATWVSWNELLSPRGGVGCSELRPGPCGEAEAGRGSRSTRMAPSSHGHHPATPQRLCPRGTKSWRPLLRPRGRVRTESVVLPPLLDLRDGQRAGLHSEDPPQPGSP